ncbi:hypothetical protein AGMMS49936_09940 [Endomicrobiia bacterium]|nr:hypothetical protein AGMMS49936_09940 [Endomicrobiia bacterium]
MTVSIHHDDWGSGNGAQVHTFNFTDILGESGMYKFDNSNYSMTYSAEYTGESRQNDNYQGYSVTKYTNNCVIYFWDYNHNQAPQANNTRTMGLNVF